MKLVAIGYLGSMIVYVNMTKEDAIKRHDKDNPTYTVEENDLSVEELEVEDIFWVYDIREQE